MENDDKGSNPTRSVCSAPEEETLRTEFEVMRKLDFAFIRELGANTAEEYMVKITELRISSKR